VPRNEFAAMTRHGGEYVSAMELMSVAAIENADFVLSGRNIMTFRLLVGLTADSASSELTLDRQDAVEAG